jgi:hypothetical protein
MGYGRKSSHKGRARQLADHGRCDVCNVNFTGASDGAQHRGGKKHINACRRAGVDPGNDGITNSKSHGGAGGGKGGKKGKKGKKGTGGWVTNMQFYGLIAQSQQQQGRHRGRHGGGRRGGGGGGGWGGRLSFNNGGGGRYDDAPFEQFSSRVGWQGGALPEKRDLQGMSNEEVFDSFMGDTMWYVVCNAISFCCYLWFLWFVVKNT